MLCCFCMWISFFLSQFIRATTNEKDKKSVNFHLQTSSVRIILCISHVFCCLVKRANKCKVRIKKTFLRKMKPTIFITEQKKESIIFRVVAVEIVRPIFIKWCYAANVSNRDSTTKSANTKMRMTEKKREKEGKRIISHASIQFGQTIRFYKYSLPLRMRKLQVFYSSFLVQLCRCGGRPCPRSVLAYAFLSFRTHELDYNA